MLSRFIKQWISENVSEIGTRVYPLKADQSNANIFPYVVYRESEFEPPVRTNSSTRMMLKRQLDITIVTRDYDIIDTIINKLYGLLVVRGDYNNYIFIHIIQKLSDDYDESDLLEYESVFTNNFSISVFYEV